VLTKFAGVAFLTIVLYPGGKNHHRPADQGAGKAHDEQWGNVVHARS
jgi:hypothetical protein